MNAQGNNEGTWRGVPITEMYGSQSPWGSPEFPLVTPSYNHAVLYHIPSTGSWAQDRPPKPQMGHDKWDHDFVRMPCSNQNLYPIEDANGDSQIKKRWEIIENALTKPIRNSHELEQAILSYNTKFKQIWEFSVLHCLFEEYLDEDESKYFFDVTLPEIAKLALALPVLIQAPIPLLKQHKNRSVSLSQQQIASLLANAFFCTFPRRNTSKRVSEYASYPHINFNSLYELGYSDCKMEKLKCLCHYFRRVCTKVPVGVVTFSRRSVVARDCPDWQQSDTPLASLPLHVDAVRTIEDAHGLIQVDFANKFLGGGVLNHGCVQEEIRFVICPELMVSMLFTEELKPDEAVMIIGCERYSRYVGYSNTFQWSGDYEDVTPRDSSGRRRCAVLAIDALCYNSVRREFTSGAVTRELNKAWVGASFYTDVQSRELQYPGIATGNWGCGAFGGSPHLKSLLQLMSCAVARRPMAYYTFEDVTLRDDIANMYNLLTRHNLTVGELYKYILRFCQKDVVRSNLHSFLQQVIKDERTNMRANCDEPMETSTSSDTSQTILPILDTSKYYNQLNDSPDLFSQEDEVDQSLLEIVIENDKTNTNEIVKTNIDDSKTRNTNQKGEEANGKMNNIIENNKHEIDAIENSNPDINNTEDNKKRDINVKVNNKSDINVAREMNDAVKNTKKETGNTKDDNKRRAGNSSETILISDESQSQEKGTLDQTSRLFNEMQKLDEESGKLNLSFSNTTPVKKDRNLSLNTGNNSNNDRRSASVSPKKRPSKGGKITDYFRKM